jgi:hypothetical protein
MGNRETVLQLVKSDEPDDVNRIAQALYGLIESFDIETLIENGETPRGYFIDPEKGILRSLQPDAATLFDAVAQLGVTLLGRMLFSRGGTALMHRVRDQVVALCLADEESFHRRGFDFIDGNEHRRWLTHLFKVCWKGIDA